MTENPDELLQCDKCREWFPKKGNITKVEGGGFVCDALRFCPECARKVADAIMETHTAIHNALYRNQGPEWVRHSILERIVGHWKPQAPRIVENLDIGSECPHRGDRERCRTCSRVLYCKHAPRPEASCFGL